MPAATTIPDVVDKLIAIMRGIPDPPVVFDGIPDEQLPPEYAQLGDTVEPTDVEGDQAWGSIGGQGAVTYETFEVSCRISVAVDGATQESQKAARDRAFAIFRSFNADLKANTTLDQLVVWCLPVKVGLIQTRPDDNDRPPSGRYADVTFFCRTYARLQQHAA